MGPDPSIMQVLWESMLMLGSTSNPWRGDRMAHPSLWSAFLSNMLLQLATGDPGKHVLHNAAADYVPACSDMERSVRHLHDSLSTLRVGRASPGMAMLIKVCKVKKLSHVATKLCGLQQRPPGQHQG